MKQEKHMSEGWIEGGRKEGRQMGVKVRGGPERLGAVTLRKERGQTGSHRFCFYSVGFTGALEDRKRKTVKMKQTEKFSG